MKMDFRKPLMSIGLGALCAAALACASLALVPTATASLPTSTPPSMVTPQSPNTATVSASATSAPTQAPTATTESLAATATVDPMLATMAAGLGSAGLLMMNPIPLYFHPVGAPQKSWHDVPIMPQATAGQEFNGNTYSYIAAATLDEARQFYAGKAAALGLPNVSGTGSGGSGSDATHDVTLTSYGLTIVLTSYDNDTSHVIVVIAKLQ